jgi:hypothetical protein
MLDDRLIWALRAVTIARIATERAAEIAYCACLAVGVIGHALRVRMGRR